MEKVKVIYILGGARSGSTVLGIILGNIQGIFYPGELFAWNRYKGLPSTGKEETREFWKVVLDDLFEQRKSFKYDFYNLMESYYSFKKLFKWGNPRMRKAYGESNAALFELLGERTKAHAVVDSSHYALRAFWLSRDPRLDVCLVYLVREPVSVVNAFLKKDVEQKAKHPLVGNFYYWIVNTLSSLFYIFYPRNKKVLVRYEDMIDEPEKTLLRVTQKLGIQGEIHGFDDLKVGPLFEANRIKNKLKIDLNKEKKDIDLSKFWQFVTKLLQMPFYVLFGYQFRRKRPGDKEREQL